MERLVRPSYVILIAGKRCTGKDFVADCISDLLMESSQTLHVSKLPTSMWVKILYAEREKIDHERLLNDRDFKEEHRQGLIDLAQNAKKEKESVWIDHSIDHILHQDDVIPECRKVFLVPDLRFLCEYKALVNHSLLNSKFKLLFLRVEASLETRMARGMVPNPEIDQCQTETELDDFEGYDLILQNDREGEDKIGQELRELLKDLL